MEEIQAYEYFLTMLSSGEASSLAIAQCRNWIFFSDDLKARNIAEKKAIEFSGTLGILKISLIKNIISLSKANKLLSNMIKKGYFSPYERLEMIL